LYISAEKSRQKQSEVVVHVENSSRFENSLPNFDRLDDVTWYDVLPVNILNHFLP